VNAKSGPNFDTAEITVIGTVEEGMVLIVKDIKPTPEGKRLTFSGYGAVINQNVVLTIFSEDGEEVEKITGRTNKIGEFEVPWDAPKDLAPGKYTIKAKDAQNEVEITFDL